ncbi:MAG: ABC transporter permease, partial [Clostridia bacterium]|nr:ABC transporter permease [Clostridia bacterium]
MLAKKAFRDLKKNFSSFLTIFIMVFIGVLAYAGILSYGTGMQAAADRFYDENNLQDLWIMGENFTEDDLKNILAIDGVKDAERSLTITTTAEGHENLSFETNFLESNRISRMYVAEGVPFDYETDGFWIDSYLAEKRELHVGDTLTLKYDDYEISGIIRGLVMTPDHVFFVEDASALFPTHDTYGICYLSMKMFPQVYFEDAARAALAEKMGISVSDVTDDLFKTMLPDFKAEEHCIFTNVFVDVEDDADVEAVRRRITDEIGAAVAVTDRDASASVVSYQSEVDEGATYSAVFAGLFLFIAILCVVSTMHRFTKKQRTQIGTLKALGFSRRRITIHYVSFGFCLSIIAAVLGVVLGRLLIGGMFIKMEQSYFEVPNMRAVVPGKVYAASASVVVIISLVTFLSCRRTLREPASDALRPEMPKAKAGTLKQSSLLSGASVGVRWNLRDIGRNKSRTLTGIAGIMGTTMLLVCAFGMKTTLNFFTEWQFDRIYDFDYKIVLSNDASDAQKQEVMNLYGNETSMTLPIEVRDADGKACTRQLVVTDAPARLKFTDHKANVKEISGDGLYLSEKLLDILGMHVGDTAEWTIYGIDGSYKSEIIGTFREPQGQTFALTRAAAEKMGLEYIPDCIYTTEDLSDVSSIGGADSIQSVEQIRDGFLSMMDVMDSVILLLVVISVILAFVIIYNLGIMSFTEKQYQFATIKVLGFTNSKIRKIYMMQNNWISIAGILLGL